MTTTIDSYTGDDGRMRLTEALKSQTIVQDSEDLAAHLIDAGELIAVGEDQILILEGADDNELYLIVSGEFSVQAEGFEIARRHAGTHLGEQALIDPTQKRSATVTSVGEGVVLKIPEARFDAVASKYPAVWRRLAAELSRRLAGNSVA